MTRAAASASTPAKVTTVDIARRLGISRPTVSTILSGAKSNTRVSDELRERVLQVAKDMGYRPSWTASALARGTTHQIGLLFPYSIPELRGIYEEMMQKTTEVFEAAGYHLLFVPTRAGWQDILRSQRLDGALVTQVTSEELSETLVSSGMPAVMVNVEGDPTLAHVMPDDAGGARLALRHLVQLGHKDIAFLRMGRASFAEHFSLRVRREAFLDAMRLAGLSDRAVVADEPLELFLDRVKLGRGGVTAVICYTHTEAVKLLPLLHARGIRVPHDVSLVCFNDVFPMADLVPAMTTVAVPGGAIGAAAADLVLRQIRGEEVSEKRVLLPESLVVRKSTAPPNS